MDKAVWVSMTSLYPEEFAYLDLVVPRDMVGDAVTQPRNQLLRVNPSPALPCCCSEGGTTEFFCSSG